MQVPNKNPMPSKPSKQPFIYKTVQFNTPIAQKTLRKHLNHYKKYVEYGDEIFTQPQWNLSQSFAQTNMHQIFPYIAKAPCSSLKIERKSEYNVFWLISHVDFHQLRILQLTNNLITNIETVAYLNCPNLQTLDLSKNKIANFKPLFKTLFKILKNLEIDHNACYEINLSRFFTNKKEQINFKYSSHKVSEQPMIVLWVNGRKQKNQQKKPVFIEQNGPIADLISFFVKLQNFKVTNETIYLMDKKDDCQTTVQHKKKRTQLCDRIVRKFTRYTTLKAFFKKFPLQDQQSDSLSDYPMKFQDAKDSLEGFEFGN